DLPFLEQHLGVPFDWALLKGRANYVCVQRLAEIAAANGGTSPPPADHPDGGPDGRGPGVAPGPSGTPPAAQLSLDGVPAAADPDELAGIAAWAASTPTGDRAELPAEVDDATWAAVSTTSRDCPGAQRCPGGDRCFAERARARAADADVVVVNLHLLGLDLAANGAILPEHDAVVVDEAHLLDDVISATAGVELGAGRFTHLTRALRGILAGAGDTIVQVAEAASLLTEAIAPHRETRLTAPLPDQLTQ